MNMFEDQNAKEDNKEKSGEETTDDLDKAL